jgi:hypothetical protein
MECQDADGIYPCYTIEGFDFTAHKSDLGQLGGIAFLEIRNLKSHLSFDIIYTVPVDYLVSLLEKDMSSNKETRIIENPKYNNKGFCTKPLLLKNQPKEDKYNLSKLIRP